MVNTYLMVGRTYRHSANDATILDLRRASDPAEAVAKTEKMFPLYTNVTAVDTRALTRRSLSALQKGRVRYGYTQLHFTTPLEVLLKTYERLITELVRSMERV